MLLLGEDSHICENILYVFHSLINTADDISMVFDSLVVFDFCTNVNGPFVQLVSCFWLVSSHR